MSEIYVTVHELDRDRRTCRVHDKRGAHRVLTYRRDCEDSMLRALCSGAEVLIAFDSGEITSANLVVGAVRP